MLHITVNYCTLYNAFRLYSSVVTELTMGIFSCPAAPATMS